MSLLKKLSTWVAGRALQLGLIEDEALDVIAFNGKANMTVSRRSALAWKRETAAGEPGWGCFMCKLLDYLAQKNHCANTLANLPIPTPNAIRAWFFISVALALLAAIPTLPILWACGVL